MEALVLGILTAAVGATAGAYGSWWIQQRQDARDASRRLEAKFHELELRIVKVEAETSAFIHAGRRDIRQEEPRDA